MLPEYLFGYCLVWLLLNAASYKQEPFISILPLLTYIVGVFSSGTI